MNHKKDLPYMLQKLSDSPSFTPIESFSVEAYVRVLTL